MSSSLPSRDQPSNSEEVTVPKNGHPSTGPHDSLRHEDPESVRAPAAKQARGFLARRDPLAWAVGTTAFLSSIAFMAVNLAYNAGNFIPPLDDAYIHLQYASQLGQGHFLQYNTGEPISTGASSLLYVLVLGAFYAIGIQGQAFLPFAMGFGSLCFALTAVCVFLIGRRVMNRRVGAWAGGLVAVNGALLWGSVSGMEIGFVALLLTAALLAFTVEAPRKHFVLTPVVAALAALSRPEAFIFTVVLCVAMTWTVLRRDRARSTSHSPSHSMSWPGTLGLLAPISLPLLAGIGQRLFYRAVTGTTTATGAQAKSLLYTPIFYPTEFLDAALTRFHGFLLVFSGLNDYAFVFPGALLVGIVGTVHLLREQPTRRPLVLAMAFGFLLVLLAISTLRTAHVHHLRYVQPFMPILLLLATIGLSAVGGLFATRRARILVTNSVFTMALVFSLSEMPAWSFRLGQQSAGIRDQQVSISNWMKGHLPPESVIAINDAGATAYFSEHDIVDLIGLTTNGLAEPNRHGPGSLYEALRRMPEQQRPDYFAVFDNWPVYGLQEGGLFGEEPLIEFQLKSPRFSRPTPGSGSACQASRLCNEVVIHKADWSDVGTGDLPAEVDPPGRIRDYLNVADLRSEQAHAYRVKPVHRGFQPTTSVETVTYSGHDVVDSGRHVIGGEVLTARNLTSGRPVTITSRIDAARPLPGTHTGSRQVRVSVDGRTVGRWHFGADGDGWHESTFTIPGRFVTDSTLRIEFGPVRTFLGPYPDYTSYGYWFSQQPAAVGP
ncbi:glycosyltransferase family 39 protein [Haloactinomyces albus]|uniref:4-amino-4-deoxy-L-arabinose transferase n=1 Tax=Haloactinomyces albus TaxID=1352928 RepID=A0AAE3ZFS2_9ACTN|nr:glycosyltransferase family 39 protein [Haloactinomyces albus]MDR7302437.1 hypothetical protein [Haloactinomyces albus]